MFIADIICNAKSNGRNNRYQVEKLPINTSTRDTTHTHTHPQKSVHQSKNILLKSMFQLVIVIDISIANGQTLNLEFVMANMCMKIVA